MTDGVGKAVGYLRVSTVEQSHSGLGLAAQLAHIEAEVSRRQWDLIETYTDSASGRSMAGRSALAAAVEAVEGGKADILVVAKLDRLSRSLADFAALLERAKGGGWSIVALDVGLDSTTHTGRLIAGVMASVAEWEREAIGLRTREALAAKRATGVRLGRPPVLPESVHDRIRAERESGATLAMIAAGLNSDSIPTAHGGRAWHASTIAAVLRQKITAPCAAGPRVTGL